MLSDLFRVILYLTFYFAGFCFIEFANEGIVDRIVKDKYHVVAGKRVSNITLNILNVCIILIEKTEGKKFLIPSILLHQKTFIFFDSFFILSFTRYTILTTKFFFILA